MPLHLGRLSHEQQEQTREARRFLQLQVRTDWSYPRAPHLLPYDYSTPLLPPSSTQQAPNATVKVDTHFANTTTKSPDLEAIGWRTRTYSSAEDDDSDDVQEKDTRHKYETPDSVGDDLAATKHRRRLRRHQRLQEEMAWNIGLAHWTAQRNTWTAATPLDASSSCDSSTSSSQTIATTPDTDLKLPIAPPLLPHHPVRTRISTFTHSEIYTKVILQGRTPSIPINLSDITKSLVQGWKEEGNWPPKPTPAEPSLVQKKGGTETKGHLKGSLKAVGRVLGFGGGTVVPVETPRGQQRQQQQQGHV